MRYKSRVMTTMACIIFATGCARGPHSISSSLRAGDDPRTGYPPSFQWPRAKEFREGQARKAKLIAEGSVDEMRQAFVYDYQQHYPSASFDASVKEVSAGLEITFRWDSPQAIFPPGGYNYNILETPKHDGRQGVAFLDLVDSGLKEMAKSLDAAGIRYQLHAIYEGKADGLPIRRGSLKYKGEYGHVSLSEAHTTLNGIAQRFDIRPGQSITNAELAALRAISMADFVNNRAGASKLIAVQRFKVVTTSDVGPTHRSAKFVLVLEPAAPAS